MAPRAEHWTEQVADRVIAAAGEGKGDDAPIVVASGISPSGPIHLGNLREVLTPYFVAEAIARRGRPVEHIHSWDDLDRFRKVPAGAPLELEQHIGKPLVDVPDPWGCHGSYADHFVAGFDESLAALGVRPRQIRQAPAYRAGTYGPSVVRAMERRTEIFDVLAGHQTADRHDRPLEERRREYYPLRVYCEACGTDDTVVTDYAEATHVARYRCNRDGTEGEVDVAGPMNAKLVWKVDWPMRWAWEGVDFEPAGADHSTPGSSRDVGVQLVRLVFDAEPPEYLAYAFVGAAGRSKMSSSLGEAPVPALALEVMEPPIVRWLYARRRPEQSFSIGFGKEIIRLYDEWDAFRRRAAEAEGADAELLALATTSRDAPVVQTPHPMPFRIVAAVSDLTQGDPEQMRRILAAHADDPARFDLAQLEPRLSCARTWTLRYEPEDERTHVREEFAADVWEELPEDGRRGVRLLVDDLERDWTLEGLTALLYGVPKRLRGLPEDAEPDAELKQAQRAFFAALYRLLVGDDTGPRLPTLLLSLGPERVRSLLAPPLRAGDQPGSSASS
ncbi:MAG TPA: lysine--tRNA ligase [Gaiellaceae bacterium]|nr:lysine--tRNA ligase [Gaiellaceae bacterium]